MNSPNYMKPTDPKKPPEKGASSSPDRKDATVARQGNVDPTHHEVTSELKVDGDEVASTKALDRKNEESRSSTSIPRTSTPNADQSKPNSPRTYFPSSSPTPRVGDARESEPSSSRPTDSSKPRKPETNAAERNPAELPKVSRETPTKDAIRNARDEQDRSGKHV